MTRNKFLTVTGLIAAGLMTSGGALAADVTVSIGGVKAADGPLYVSLQKEDQFMQAEGAYGEIISNPSSGDISVTLSGVEEGEYAVSIWHDINNNDAFDRDENWWPLDGWSMSGTTSFSGPPSFEDVKFTVDGDTDVSVEMVYPE